MYHIFLKEVPPENITWVERYEKAYNPLTGRFEETWDEVKLRYDPKFKAFHSPKWIRTSREKIMGKEEASNARITD